MKLLILNRCKDIRLILILSQEFQFVNNPFFERLANNIPKGKICVIGCGRGYAAVTFGLADFDVTAIDFAETAVMATRERARKSNVDMQVLMEDIFDLPDELFGNFDYVMEYTCF